jgi:hypothetical protein
VTSDVEHGIVTPHHAVGRCVAHSHVRHILCVCVDLQVVCCTSPFGECAALCISSSPLELEPSYMSIWISTLP